MWKHERTCTKVRPNFQPDGCGKVALWKGKVGKSRCQTFLVDLTPRAGVRKVVPPAKCEGRSETDPDAPVENGSPENASRFRQNATHPAKIHALG